MAVFAVTAVAGLAGATSTAPGTPPGSPAPGGTASNAAATTPLDGLIQRPDGYEARPAPKPDEPEALHSAGSCELSDPLLNWSALPRHLRAVPLHKKIGQLLVVSYSGKTPDARGVAIAREALENSEIGGLLTFRHNIGSASDVRAINEVFASAHPYLPAIVAVDQEGGAVMRVKPSEGGPPTPSARDVAKGSADDAADTYRAMAEALADLGFTVNFGPVVDLEVNPKNPVIARFGRAFGAEPETVLAFARAFIDAHHDAGVATALKHFPGHGSSRADSHEGAIDLTPTWSREELIPFERLIEEGRSDMVMIGHLELDGVSGPDDLPASLSPIAIDGVLRRGLCFEGLVVSDDLAMDAIENRWGSPEATRLMIEAGGDIALVSLPAGKGMELVREITDYLVEAAEASPDLRRKIEEAYVRIVHFKHQQANAAGSADRAKSDQKNATDVAAGVPANAAE
ncbi:MAG: glycoside hydrolase family 3 N-terminal domain-containing protein [Pseudomonadota bacterium]